MLIENKLATNGSSRLSILSPCLGLGPSDVPRPAQLAITRPPLSIIHSHHLRQVRVQTWSSYFIHCTCTIHCRALPYPALLCSALPSLSLSLSLSHALPLSFLLSFPLDGHIVAPIL